MLEKYAEWRVFRRLFESTMSAEQIAHETRLSPSLVKGYHEQYNCHRTLSGGSHTIPQNMVRHVVGFRYANLGRWMGTDKERMAGIEYDRGTVEVAQGKFLINGEAAYVMFAIPRKKPVIRNRPYFTAVAE